MACVGGVVRFTGFVGRVMWCAVETGVQIKVNGNYNSYYGLSRCSKWCVLVCAVLATCKLR